MNKNKSLIVSENNITVKEIEDFLFETDKELEKIFLNDKLYEIAYTLEHNSLYNWDNDAYLNDLKREKIPNNFMKKVIVFMVLKWLPEVVLLKEKFDIAVEDISVDIFLNWIKEQGKNIFVSDYFSKYIFLCSDLEKLIYEIWRLWYINIVYEFVEKYNICIPKFSKDEIINITENLEKYINSFSLMERITLWWYYDWYNLIDTLFEKSNNVLDYILKLFQIKDNEKKEFIDIKENHFNILYKKFLEDIKYEIVEKNFTIVSKFEHNLLTKDKFTNKFVINLKENLNKLNYANWFVAHFWDVTWSNITFSISNDNYKFWYAYNLLQKEQFYKDVLDYYELFKQNLEKNNLDFVVLLAKSNWTKDFTDNSEENYFKKAA